MLLLLHHHRRPSQTFSISIHSLSISHRHCLHWSHTFTPSRLHSYSLVRSFIWNSSCILCSRRFSLSLSLSLPFWIFTYSHLIMHTLYMHRVYHQRTLTYGKVSLYGWPPIYFVWIQLLCFCWISNSFTCSVKSKPVKQEVSCTVLIPPMLSILWYRPTYTNTQSLSLVSSLQRSVSLTHLWIGTPFTLLHFSIFQSFIFL